MFAPCDMDNNILSSIGRIKMLHCVYIDKKIAIPQTVLVHIEPVSDQPPKEVPGSRRCLEVKETDVVYITRQHLHFVGQDSPDSELTYTVTTPPVNTGPHRCVTLVYTVCGDGLWKWTVGLDCN